MMKINFKKLNIKNTEQLKSLVKWDNDLEFRHLIRRTEDKNEVIKPITFNKLKTRYEDNPKRAEGIYIIYDNNRQIGNFSLQIDPEHLLRKIKGTSWLGFTIGEKEYWGSGAAKIAMEFFEQESISLGLTRVELGAFECNPRAEKFYKKMGYKEIGRFADFTYWDGRYWSDIRMEKYLK